MKPEQLQFDFMDDGEPCPMASNDNPPDDVGVSDDEERESAVLLILPTRKAVPRS